MNQEISMKQQLIVLAFLATSGTSLAQDATQTDGDKYKVLLDNACVRVLEYRDQPGEATHQHYHPAFVLYALDPFERVIHLPNGKNINRKFKSGDVIWSPAQTHIGQNVGPTPTHAIIVEAKPDGKSSPECSGQ
jgi:beta-alanine degradation protein BauB